MVCKPINILKTLKKQITRGTSMKIKLQNSILFLALSAALLCAGCATGPSNTQTQAPRITVPAGKALVYLYRKPDMLLCMDTASIKANGQLIGYSKNGNYISHIASPGKIVLLANKGPGFTNFGLISVIQNKSQIELNAEAGKTYYVRVFLEPAGLAGGFTPKMEWVRNETGAAEISKCKMSN